MQWRWAAASVVGTSHVSAGTRKQDAFVVKQLTPHDLLVIVSDGAGSASFGGQGASIVCRHLSRCCAEWFAVQSEAPTDEVLRGWIDEVRDRISLAAERRGVARRQFAATLAFGLQCGSELIAIQIGDSCLVARAGDEWEVILWPESGEFASTTYFVTDDPEPRLTIRRVCTQFDALAAFSDGLEMLALRHSDQSAHKPFFRPMLKPVDEAEGVGKQHHLSSALAQWLGSSAVCDRTDDDKTLILLSRV